MHKLIYDNLVITNYDLQIPYNIIYKQKNITTKK